VVKKVIFVGTNALKDSGTSYKKIFYNIIKRIITQSYPNWLLDYSAIGAFVHAIGLEVGLYNKKIIYKNHLSFIEMIKLNM
jgi:hypothetical protein